MADKVKILDITPVTHDTKRYLVERPEGLEFTPGQAAHVSINKPGLEDKVRPFTFTSLREDKDLEFIIKAYKEHDGVTKEFDKLEPGDELIIHDVFGAIRYKGPGVFIAGGAGITPFIAIFRMLRRDGKLEGNTLIFTNKAARDIMLKQELKEMLGDRLILTVTREANPGYDNRRVDKAFLQEKINDFSQHFYLCGPPPMVVALKQALGELGARTESVVFEG